MSSKLLNTKLVQKQLRERLLPRLLTKHVAPLRIGVRHNARKKRKDRNFEENLETAYNEALDNPFPAGPWPFHMGSYGWVTFTMDEKSAARFKFEKHKAKDKEEAAEFPYRLDLQIEKEDENLHGQFQQMYVEKTDDGKRISISKWERGISTVKWHDKMFLCYHENWHKMNTERGAIIKEDQRARLDEERSLVSLDDLEPDPTRIYTPRKDMKVYILVSLLFYFLFLFFFLMCAQCRPQCRGSTSEYLP